MNDSNFYRAFEDLHRGSRELMQSRLTVFLPFVRSITQLLPGAMVTDLGCGRGEWLELLQQNGIAAQGVDLDDGMLAACRELGLDVRRGDAVAFLKDLPSGSQAVISGFHIAEHLPFDTLHAMVAESLRALRPGGLLILESPNPENLAVGTSGFYMDPTHERPLPPALLSFLAQFHGFERVKTLRLQEGPTLRGEALLTLEDVLAGVSPDYAVIAQKAPGEALSTPARPEALTALDTAFAQEYGVTLHSLAQRYERQWVVRLQHAQAVAEAARSAALAAQSTNARVVEQMAAFDERVQGQLAAFHGQLAGQLQRALNELDAERQEVQQIQVSLRPSAPVRWAREQGQALRDQGVRERGRRLVRKAVRSAARVALRVLDRSPKARKKVAGAIRATGLSGFASRVLGRVGTVVQAPPPPPPTAGMTPVAQRIHESLKRAVSAAALSGKKE